MIHKIINEVIPPFLKRIYKSFRKLNYHPQWITLKGKLEGILFFLDPDTLMGKELIEGHDSFFYTVIDDVKKDKPDLIIYDIGAHFGYHALGFAKFVGEQGKVYAFEPHPLNLDRLKQNIAGNPELAPFINVKCVGISDNDGQAIFRMYKNIEAGISSASCIIESKTTAKIDGNLFREIQITLAKIDTLVEKKEIFPPNIIKLDIEGAEYFALLGSYETIIKFKPVLLIEIHSIKNMYLITNFLQKLNYSSILMAEEKDGRCFIHCFST